MGGEGASGEGERAPRCQALVPSLVGCSFFRFFCFCCFCCACCFLLLIAAWMMNLQVSAAASGGHDLPSATGIGFVIDLGMGCDLLPSACFFRPHVVFFCSWIFCFWIPGFPNLLQLWWFRLHASSFQKLRQHGIEESTAEISANISLLKPRLGFCSVLSR